MRIQEVLMEKPCSQGIPAGQAEQHTPPPPADRQPWNEPKLTFVEPQLTAHGDLKKVTGQGFFGGFTP
jgi:hypothetical protein